MKRAMAKKRVAARRVNPAYPGRVKRAAEAEINEARTRARTEARQRALANVARDKPKAVRVTDMALNRMSNKELARRGFARLGVENDPNSIVVRARKLMAPELPPGVVPTKGRIPAPLAGEIKHFALDSATTAPLYTWANSYAAQIGFPGYPYLAQLSLRAEYKAPAETTAKEMTRRWIKWKSASAGDKTAKIAAIEELWRTLDIRSKMRTALEYDGYFGRYQLFMDIQGDESDVARQKPLNLEAGLFKGCLLNVQGIEPMWTTPYSYNSIDPTRADFYKPVSWFVLGRKTHATRLIDIVSRPVPDLFKPAYNFGGISMSQLMEPYVMQWYRARDSVSDIMYRFSTSGIATNLSSLLEEDDSGESTRKRAEFFNEVAGSRGLLLIDKDTEEFFQFNTPLSSLDKLMAQFQEHMSAPSHTPQVKLLGLSPAGLNASSEGEIKVYYDWTHSEQESVLTNPIVILNKVSQWHLFGSYDPDICHEYVQLDEPTQKEMAEIRTADATAGSNYIANGVITNAEERQRLQSDPNSGYNNLKGGPPEMTPDQEHDLNMTSMQQEHASGEADKDRKHATGERKDGQKFGSKEADKDRKVAAKAAKKKKA